MAATAAAKKTKEQNENRKKEQLSRSNHKQNQGKFGPLPSFPLQKVFVRSVIVVCAAVVFYYSSKRNIFASQKDFLEKKSQNVTCSESYKSEAIKFGACLPSKCGRFVTDSLITNEELDTLLAVAKKCTELKNADESVSIFVLHTGALSFGQRFVNFYKLPESKGIITPEFLSVYSGVLKKIHAAVSSHFGIQSDILHFTEINFFSRITDRPPKNIHDEYWHPHVDIETYEYIHYSTLLYLTDYSKDFHGGRFMFVDSRNKTTVIEPRKGRLSVFTSGEENSHYVEQVSDGIRYTMMASFTCDPTKSIKLDRPKGAEL